MFVIGRDELAEPCDTQVDQVASLLLVVSRALRVGPDCCIGYLLSVRVAVLNGAAAVKAAFTNSGDVV